MSLAGFTKTCAFAQERYGVLSAMLVHVDGKMVVTSLMRKRPYVASSSVVEAFSK